MAQGLPFSVTYDGRGASAHVINMRHFGEALVGLDGVINRGLIGLAERRIPTSRERIRVVLDVSEPRHGCVAIVGAAVSVYQAIQPVLPFIIEQFKEKSFDLILHWLGAVFNIHGGRAKDADKHIDKLIDAFSQTNERIMDDRQAEREAIFADKQHEREFILRLIESVKNDAVRVVTPLGKSAATVSFGIKFDERSVTVDEPMAQAVRSKDDLEIGDMETMTVMLDAPFRQRGAAKVEIEGMLGRLIQAEIRDPRFNTSDDPYVAAFASRTPLRVLARRAIREGETLKIYIMDTAR